VSLPQSSYGEYDRAEVLPFLPAEAKSFLDIGCARSSFGRMIRRERGDGVRLWASSRLPSRQLSPAGLAMTRLWRATFRMPSPAPTNGFDCIVLNDVLEHMLDPWSVVAGLGGCWQRTAESSPPSLVFSSFPCG
jgi:hypothetical protein